MRKTFTLTCFIIGTLFLVFLIEETAFAKGISRKQKTELEMSLKKIITGNYLLEYLRGGSYTGFSYMIFRQWFQKCRRYQESESLSKKGKNTHLSDGDNYSQLKRYSIPPNDLYYSKQWGLSQINIEKAWNFATGKDIVVAVLDTGLDYNHPDIIDQLYYNTFEVPEDGKDNDGNGYVDDYLGWDFAGVEWNNYKSDNNVIDKNGHGTHVAGIIAAAGNNSEGIIGVAPEAKILPVKVLDDSGRGTLNTIAMGIKYAVDMGAQIINLSLGGTAQVSLNSLIARMISYAANKGCVLVSSAGNSRMNVANFCPANMAEVIAVSATSGTKDQIAHFSNYGASIELAAPGVNILSLRAEGTGTGQESAFLPSRDPVAEYMTKNGTSMSAPFVSGVAALLKSNYASLTADQIRQILQLSAKDLGTVGFDPYYGYGRLDAYEALLYTEAMKVYGEDLNRVENIINSGFLPVSGSNAVTTQTEVICGVMEEVMSKNHVEIKNQEEFSGYSIIEEIYSVQPIK